MELQVGEYFIPKDCTIRRIGQTIQVYRKRKDRLDVGEYRCKDCKHYVKGYTNAIYYWTTDVCEMKPKAPSKKQLSNPQLANRKLYFAAQKYGKPCDNFELRNRW